MAYFDPPDKTTMPREHPFAKMIAVRDGAATKGVTKIGDLRAYLLVPFDCKWNGLVRDITAGHESEGEVVDVLGVFKELVSVFRDNGQLDKMFPMQGGKPSRLNSLFD